MEGSFGRLGIGVPLFKMVPEFWLSWTQLLLGGLRPGDAVLNMLGRDGRPTIEMTVRLPLAHNQIIRQFLKTDLDTLLIIEDDHAFPMNQADKMRDKAENQAFDIVCASYTNRRIQGCPTPVGWCMPESKEGRAEYRGRFELGKIRGEGTQEYDGAALGFVLVRRWVLEAMCGDNDPASYMWVDCIGETSPDMPFYYRAHEVGAGVGVDRDNAIAHMGIKGYTMADFWPWLEWQKERLQED